MYPACKQNWAARFQDDEFTVTPTDASGDVSTTTTTLKSLVVNRTVEPSLWLIPRRSPVRKRRRGELRTQPNV
jgi:hypothetical protein